MIVMRTPEELMGHRAPSAVALGMFDGVHIGHQAVLTAAVESAAANGLAPGVFTFALSDAMLGAKGAGRLSSTGVMEGLLADIGMQFAYSPHFSDLRDATAEQFVQYVLRDGLNAQYVCCGYNFSFARGGSASAYDLMELCALDDITCEIIPEVDAGGAAVSSTRIRDLIADGNIRAANELLGHLFTIDFAVVQGNRIGRTLGSPTINQPFPPGFVVPRYGVYATIATVNGTAYSGVSNVGVKPTVGSDTPLCETYIQGFSGDLYGREVEVGFLEFIRPERKFASLEELRENIMRNANTAANIAARYNVNKSAWRTNRIKE